MHLSARGEDFEEDGLESPALALRVTLGELGGARRGGAASRWQLDGGTVDKEEAVDFVAELGRKVEEGEWGAFRWGFT